jgi:hypothetical protein
MAYADSCQDREHNSKGRCQIESRFHAHDPVIPNALIDKKKSWMTGVLKIREYTD